jgi:hypothetical protein
MALPFIEGHFGKTRSPGNSDGIARTRLSDVTTLCRHLFIPAGCDSFALQTRHGVRSSLSPDWSGTAASGGNIEAKTKAFLDRWRQVCAFGAKIEFRN